MESRLAELRKFVSPELIFGREARRLAGRYARNLGGTKALVVSDPGVVAAGWAADVIESLEALGLPHALYHDVSPNPRAEEVTEGVRLFQAEGCNLLVAVGGGSVMDCAKGIGIVQANGGHIVDYEGVDRIPAPIPPLVCVPTTGGTGADVSQFAIITDTPNRNKIAIVSKTVVPDVSLVDPETLVSMPPDLTVHSAFDALTHGVEAYVSNASSPLTDLFALEAIRLIATHLLPSYLDPANMALRRQLMLASLEAGLAFSNASLGIIHAMAHSLGGLLDLPHGLCNSMLLGVGIAYNFPAAPERYRAIAEAMGLSVGGMDADGAKEALVAAIDRLREGTGVRASLRQVGVTPAEIPELAVKAIRDACLVTNPRAPTLRDIEALYEQAL